MTGATTVLTLLVIPLAIDPRLVRPGLTPLLVLLGLMVALGLLYLSLRRQLRRINLPHRDELEKRGESPSESDAGEDR